MQVFENGKWHFDSFTKFLTIHLKSQLTKQKIRYEKSLIKALNSYKNHSLAGKKIKFLLENDPKKKKFTSSLSWQSSNTKPAQNWSWYDDNHSILNLTNPTNKMFMRLIY